MKATEAALPTRVDRTVPWRGAVMVAGFTLQPFAAFLATNRHEGVSPGQVAPYVGALLAAGLLLVGVGWAIRGSHFADRVAVVVSTAVFVTFNYVGISSGLEALGLRVRYQLLGWFLALVAMAAGGWVLSRRKVVREWLLIVAVLLAVIPSVQVTWHRLSVTGAAPAEAAGEGSSLKRTPDIYFVVPDGYGRADQLAEVVGFDNSDFIAALEGRGFLVAHEAYANYPTTFLSVASTLHMDYLVDEGPDALKLADDGRQFDRSRFYDIIRGESALVSTLRDAGYRHVQAPPGTWAGSACSGTEDLCVEPIGETDGGVVLGELQWALLQLTPVATLLERGLGHTFDKVSSDPVHTVREIQRQRFSEPVFAFIHMLHPHPPLRFDAQCAPLDVGDRDLTGWSEEVRAVYPEGIRCTNRRLLAMLDVLPRDAVVVIQADHGSNFLGGVSTDVHEWEPRQTEERLAILSAVRLPRDCRSLVGSRFGGVNTFRVILACLRGEDPDLLADRYLLARYHTETEVNEVELPEN